MDNFLQIHSVRHDGFNCLKYDWKKRKIQISATCAVQVYRISIQLHSNQALNNYVKIWI